MDKDTDGKLFAAALYVITDMWGKEMGDLQRASLANQIVREIERRGIVMPAAAAEPPSSGDGANTDYVMVPRKASDEMVEQARMTLPGIVDICDADIEDIYETMIAAAPPSPRSDEGSRLTPSAHGASTAAASLSREVAGHPWYIQDAIKRLNLQAETLLGFNEFMADRQIVELRKRDAAFYQHVADTLASLYSEVKSLRDRLNHAAASEAPTSADHLDEDYETLTAQSTALSPALRAQEEFNNTADMTHVPWTKAHDGHDPSDPRVVTVENIAMMLCSSCSAGDKRWRSRECWGEWAHDGDSAAYGDADECEASAMLTASVELGIPIYTGADLTFQDEDYEPRGLSAAEAPTSAEGVTPNPPEVS